MPEAFCSPNLVALPITSQELGRGENLFVPQPKWDYQIAKIFQVTGGGLDPPCYFFEDRFSNSSKFDEKGLEEGAFFPSQRST